ncbi:MAG: ATP-binding protein [Cyclobacteriaceae bacterium]
MRTFSTLLCHAVRSWLFSWGILLLCSQQLYALHFQEIYQDSVQIMQKLDLAEAAIADQRQEDANRLATEALQASQTSRWSPGEARSHLLLGQAHSLQKELSPGLEHLLRAAYHYETLGQQQGMAEAFFHLGRLLIDWPAYELALKYLDKAAQLAQQVKSPDLQARLYQLIGEVHLRQNNLAAAIKATRKAELLLTPETSKLWLSIQTQLSLAYTRLGQLDSALYFALKENALVSQKGDLSQQFSVCNKVAYLYRLLGQPDTSLDYLRQAELLLSKNKNDLSPAQQVTLLNNLAVTLLINEDFLQARSYFDQSVRTALDYWLLKEEADTRNLLAAAYLAEGKFSLAEAQSELVLEMKDNADLLKPVAEAYRIKSEVALRNNDYRRSLAYEKRYYQTLARLEVQQEEATAKLKASGKLAEQQEQTILDMIDNEEKQALLRRQLELETRQQRQALALQQSQVELLQQEKKLQQQQLEKQLLEQLQVKQALSLSRERLQAAEREKELEEMRSTRERQELLIRQQQLEEQSRKREMELLEAQNLAQNKELALETKNRNYLQLALMSALAFIILILFFLYRRNQDNKMLKEQQQEIQQKNEELRASEEELKQNMDQLQLTQEVVAKQKEMLQVTGNFGVWEYNLANEKIICNEQFLKMLGLGADDFSGALDFWKQRIHPDDLPEFEQQFDKCLNGEEVSTLQYRINSPKRGERYVNAAMRPVYDHEELISLVGVVMDVTHIKENEAALAQKNEDLEKINSELDHFVYRTSHNLRAPLASVMGLVSLMEQVDSKEEQSVYLKHISSSMVKLDETIQEINNYSKNARVELNLEEVNLIELVKDVFETLLFMRGKESVEFSLDIPDSLRIISDASRLKIIFNNLLSNAMKYVHPVTGDCKIRVAATVLKGKLEIMVADQGMGIPEEYQSRIFEMFFRATNAAPGSGLGLYIVKEAVNKLNGSIRLESREGEGTTFFLSLPLHEAREQDVSQLEAV